MIAGVSIIIGKVESIEKDGTTIRFKIPSVMDNLPAGTYPIAKAIGNHSFNIELNNTVFITRPNPETNVFFYQPLDFEDFIGLRRKISDGTNEVIVGKKSIEINASPSSKFVLTVNGKSIFDISTNELGETIIDINSESTDVINPLLNKSFTCANCFMTGALHGTNKKEA